MDENKNHLGEQAPSVPEQLVPTPEPAAAEPSPAVVEDATAVFTPVQTDAVQAHMEDLNGQINDNWLEEFLLKKQEEEAEAAAVAAAEAEEAAVEEALTLAEALTGWEPPAEVPADDDEKEIGVDPMAVAAAGLIAPEDRELEKILAEDWDATASRPAVEAETADEAAEEIAEETEEAPEEEDVVVLDGKKRRPRMNKSGGLLGILFGLPHVLCTAVLIAMAIFIGVQLGNIIWLGVSDVMAFGKEPQSITLTITEEDLADSIEPVAKKLGDAGIIRYPGLFQKFAELTGKDARLDPGTYTLNSQLDYNALLKNMVYYGPVQDIVEIMFPEGYNCAQIFAKLEEKGVCSVAELEEYAANGELPDYWFLEGVERGHKYCLEGYLSPNTYQFYTNDDPGRVLEKFLDAFSAGFTDKMKEDFAAMQQRYNQALSNNGYGDEYIANNPLTLHKVVTLASIVQKETAGNDESYNIASVFYNRLTNPADHPYLGSDATVYYAIGDYFGEIEELTQAHLDTDSPYNTRNHRGLPPGPICNPGAYTMYAALDPNETNYYYFVYSANDGEHWFAGTLKEHEDNLKKLGLW